MEINEKVWFFLHLYSRQPATKDSVKLPKKTVHIYNCRIDYDDLRYLAPLDLPQIRTQQF